MGGAEISLWPWRWLLLPAVAVLCLAAAFKLLELLWWKPRSLEEHFAKQGIKGPPYRFLTGNLREMVALMLKASSKPMAHQRSHNVLPRVLSFYHQWKKIYGSTFLLWFGPTARLAIADPELIREIFISRADFFDRYESHPLVRQLEGEGLVSLRGEKWARRRKVLSPAFHMDNLALLIPKIGKTVLDMVERLEAMSTSSAAGAGSGQLEIDVSDWFQGVTEDAITRTAFGRSYDDGKAVFPLQAQQMLFAAEAFRMALIPGYRYLPTKKNTNSWKLDKEIQQSLARLIGRRREEAGHIAAEVEDGKADGGGEASSSAAAAAKDLLGLMINASVGRRPGVITVREIVEECKTFFFAGKQTTTNLLTWTTLLLAMHPDWQERARQEILHVCSARDIPSLEQLAKLKMLGMILNETLRLYPPAVATIRRAKASVKLGGFEIPQGTELLIPIMAVHHDERLWGADAAQFNPARFAGGVSRAAQHSMAFIPFGIGARMCIGQNLALLEAKLTMALILRRFSLGLSPSYIHAPTVLMLLYPQYGAPVIFSPLSSSGHHSRPQAQAGIIF